MLQTLDRANCDDDDGNGCGGWRLRDAAPKDPASCTCATKLGTGDNVHVTLQGYLHLIGGDATAGGRPAGFWVRVFGFSVTILYIKATLVYLTGFLRSVSSMVEMK